jgi:hypothetical protein
VVERQALLIARWMHVGFVHGVMNTDNTALSGETIDFGPCAFMDSYDPATAFSAIDEFGRYAYANQPTIAQWNLARFAETLLPLLDSRADGRTCERGDLRRPPLGELNRAFLRSTPTTEPDGPTASATRKATSPGPAPRSSTRMPGRMPLSRINRHVSPSTHSACSCRRSSSASDPGSK